MDVTDPDTIWQGLMQWNSRLSQQESQILSLTAQNQTLTTRLAAIYGRILYARVFLLKEGAPGLVDTRLWGKPEGFSGKPGKFPDWLKAYFGTIDVRYQAMTAIAEQASTPSLNAGLSSEKAQLSPQLLDVFAVAKQHICFIFKTDLRGGLFFSS